MKSTKWYRKFWFVIPNHVHVHPEYNKWYHKSLKLFKVINWTLENMLAKFQLQQRSRSNQNKWSSMPKINTFTQKLLGWPKHEVLLLSSDHNFTLTDKWTDFHPWCNQPFICWCKMDYCWAIALLSPCGWAGTMCQWIHQLGFCFTSLESWILDKIDTSVK